MSRKLNTTGRLLIPLLFLPGPAAGGESAVGYSQVGVASSFADVTLAPGTKLLVILASGETVRGGAANIGANALSIYADDELRRLRESEVYQIFQLTSRSRGRGAAHGALIGAGAALAMALFADPTESDETRFLLVGVVGIASVPTGAAIGALVSGEKKELVYQNPTVSVPWLSRAFRDFSFNVATGPNLIGGGPGSYSGPTRSVALQGIYRATPRWGFGGELLLTRTGTWKWQYGEESREITAPGFKIYFFPVHGRHELYAVGGYSAFLQRTTQSQYTIRQGRVQSYAFSETKLDYFLNGGFGYHYYFTRRVGVGGEFQIYEGSNYPDPLMRFSVSLSVRN